MIPQVSSALSSLLKGLLLKLNFIAFYISSVTSVNGNKKMTRASI